MRNEIQREEQNYVVTTEDMSQKEEISLKRIRPEVESIPMTSIQWNRTSPF